MRWPSSLPTLLVVGLLAVLFAGCIGEPAPRPGAPEPVTPAIVPGIAVEPFWDDPIEDGLEHDHADPAQHADHRNMALLGHLGRDVTDQGEFGEIDVVGDSVLQCLVQDGFRILDIEDRVVPVEVGRFSGTRCYDVKATADGALAVVSGKHLVDITNRSAPREVHRYDHGCHMCFVKEIDGAEYVFLAQSFGMLRSTVPVQGIIEIVRIDRGDPLSDSTMEHVADWSAPLSAYPNSHLVDANPYELSIHDMYVYDDPLLGIPVMVVAHWDMGVFLVDVSDPTEPRTLGHWDDFMGDCGDIHTVEIDFIDGRRVIAAATENGLIIDPACSAARWSVGFVYLIDATDIEHPETLGKWHVPGSGPLARPSESWSSFGEPVGPYSAHNIHFLGGRVYEAMYHGGVFVLDAAGFVAGGGADRLSTFLREDTVPTLGVYFPSCADGGPHVWDVFPKDGHLYVSDTRCGLYVLHFLGDPLPDPRLTGDA
ncbi:MAG: hypothetical protein KY455_06310 [Euryarchaeota archaeon]|nr:hypothetical protein [Euryarchaeota archaeon]